MIKMTATAIKRKRIEKGLTIIDLANAVNLSRTSLYSYENGKNFPNPASIGKIAEVLGCEIKDLID